MKNPTTWKLQPTRSLDANPQQPDFLILTLASPWAGGKRRAKLKPKVQRLWKVIVKKRKD
jgi:hypothetical protein